MTNLPHGTMTHGSHTLTENLRDIHEKLEC